MINIGRFVSFHVAVIVGLLASTIVLADLSTRRIPDDLHIPLNQIASEMTGWTVVKDHTLQERVFKALHPTSYLSRTYRKGSSDLDLLIVYYAQQRAGESMHSPRNCLPGSGWEMWPRGSALVSVGKQQVRVNKYSLQHQDSKMLLVYWYESKDRIVANEYFGKLLLLRDTLLTGHTGGSLVRLILPDVPEAENDAVAFASKLIPELQRCFGSTGSIASE